MTLINHFIERGQLVYKHTGRYDAQCCCRYSFNTGSADFINQLR
ncbi:MAG: hypothetical protein JWP81_3047 [Ferruginibacter sp.]|nr:hypothetical protein [Ferruginibacter sp.]